MLVFDADDPPMADPQIRKDYEASLGAFILAYNAVDFRLAMVVLRATDKVPEAAKILKEEVAKAGFPMRLTIFAILQSFLEGHIKNVNVDRLRQLNADRNKVVHGYMDQNPFDGSYKILERKSFDEKTAFPIELLINHRRELEEIAEALAQAEFDLELEDLD